MKGRSIKTHIHIKRSVLQAVSGATDKADLIQIDLAKSFGKFRPDLFFEVLEHANIGDVLLKGISLSHKESCKRLIPNQALHIPVPLKSTF